MKSKLETLSRLVLFFLASFSLMSFSLMSFGAQANQVDELPKDSLYKIDFHWKNQEGDLADFKKFKGETVIVTMVYTSCPYACPLTITKLQSIEKDLKKNGVKNYRFVLASFDTEKDTPEHLEAFMKKKKISPKNWTFLSATSDDEVRKLAVLLDISYQKIDGGDFSHSNTITLLDPVGRVALKLKGVASPHEDLIAKAVEYESKK